MSKITHLPEVTVVINTKNAAETLPNALKSVKSWANEIVVVDMHSTDDTVSLAKKAGAEVFLFKDVGFVEPARNFAIQKAKTQWVLLLDADEEVPETLWKYLSELQTKTHSVVGYYLPRQNFVFGDWLKAGWWPDYQLRFFQKDAVKWSEDVHGVPRANGTTELIPAQPDLAIIHHNYTTVAEYIERLNRYTTFEVPKYTGKTPTASDLVKVMSDEWMRRLFLEQGIQAGMRGVSMALLQGMYQVVTQLKVWEQQEATHPSTQRQGDDSEAVLRELSGMHARLGYWLADYRVSQSQGIFRWYWRIRRRLQW